MFDIRSHTEGYFSQPSLTGIFTGAAQSDFLSDAEDLSNNVCVSSCNHRLTHNIRQIIPLDRGFMSYHFDSV